MRLLLDPAHYEGPSTEHVVAPVLLGRTAKKLLDPRAREPADPGAPPGVGKTHLAIALAVRAVETGLLDPTAEARS